VSRDGLPSATAAERARARARGCVQQLRASFDPALSASALDTGWRSLSGEFRLLRVGSAR
jgi:hypothetical protein